MTTIALKLLSTDVAVLKTELAQLQITSDTSVTENSEQ